MKIKPIACALILVLSSCMREINMPRSLPIQKQKIIVTTAQTACISFKRISNNNDILVNLTWEKNRGGEYSRIGPISGIIIQENGEKFDDVTNYNPQKIEDVDLDSVNLRSTKIGEYELVMAWGAGEDLYYPQVLLIK